MARVVSLHFPTFPTDRYRRALGDKAPPAGEPLVMVGRRGSRREIVALDHAAASIGLRILFPSYVVTL